MRRVKKIPGGDAAGTRKGGMTVRVGEVLKRIGYYTLIIGLLAVMIYSGTQLWGYWRENQAQKELDSRWQQYRPSIPPAADGTPPTTSGTDEPVIVNPGVLEAQQVNPDVVGWLTVPGTTIDYPFVLGEDNRYYLTHNVQKEEARAGALFLDARCDPAFFDADYAGMPANAIIYGHYMKNGTMFADVRKCRDKAYFDAHPEGWVFLPEGTYRLRFFALVVTDAYDEELYGLTPDAAAYRDYVLGRALHTREVPLPENARILALSTCTYEFEAARAILVGVLGKV